MIESAEIEQAAIGDMLTNSDNIDIALGEIGIKAEMFAVPKNMTIAKTVIETYEKLQGSVDATLIAGRLRDKGVYDEIGGIAYLIACMDLSTGISIKAKEHFEEIHNLHLRRRVEQVSQENIERAQTESDGRGLAMTAPQAYYGLIEAQNKEESIAEALKSCRERWEDIRQGRAQMEGIPTGIHFWDKMLGGLKPGYHCIAARPRCGKTTFAGEIAQNMNIAGIPNAWVNMDMPKKDLYQRNVSRLSGVSLNRLSRGVCSREEMDKVDSAIEQMAQFPQHFLHATFDVAKICAWVRMMKRHHDIQMVVIDYIQQCKAPGEKLTGKNFLVEHCSSELKRMAQQLDIPMLVLAQIGRGPDKENRPYRLDDLKDSGSLEQDAQTVTLLYTENRLAETVRDIDQTRPVWVDIAKQQNGPPGAKEFWMHGPKFKFEEAERLWGYADAF